MPTNGTHGTKGTNGTNSVSCTTSMNGTTSITGINDCVPFGGIYSSNIILFIQKQNHKIIYYEYMKEKETL